MQHVEVTKTALNSWSKGFMTAASVRFTLYVISDQTSNLKTNSSADVEPLSIQKLNLSTSCSHV